MPISMMPMPMTTSLDNARSGVTTCAHEQVAAGRRMAGGDLARLPAAAAPTGRRAARIPLLNRRARLGDFGLTLRARPLYKHGTSPMAPSRRPFSAALIRLHAAAVTCALLWPAAAWAGGPAGPAEAERRQQAAMEAQELLHHGDRAYESGDYAQAVEAYSGAVEGLPDAPATAVLRAAAVERLVTATIERAHQLVRGGDLAGAKTALDQVLVAGVAADDARARRARAELDDPQRTNPALTAAHGRDVDEVRRLLYTAEGAFELGSLDRAADLYQKVLGIDPANTAARRGLEQVAAARSDYHRAARDSRRAEMLADVDRGWELQAPPPAEQVMELLHGDGQGRQVAIESKLDRIIFPVIDMEDTTLSEAADFLRSQSQQLDILELDPALRGVGIVLDLGPEDAPEGQQARTARINLKLRRVPLRSVLDYVTSATRTTWVIDEFAVVIRPAGGSSGTMVTRSYRVPPDFLTTGVGASGQVPAAADPFAAESQEEGLLARRRSAQEVLQEQGVSFPEGASASFNTAASTLLVRNTSEMHLLVEQIVHAAAETEPVQVVVKLTIMKVEERRLKELSFDWLISPFDFGHEVFPGGGTVGNGSVLGAIPAPPFTSPLTLPLTAGNRSGDAAAPPDGIDALIQETQRGFSAASRRAPGILTFNGLLSDGQFQVMMRGLDQAKGIDWVQTPSTVTRSGQRSSISVVREFIYPTEYEPPELPNQVGDVGGDIFGGGGGGVQNFSPVTPATPTAFEPRTVGMVLEVEPVVSADRRFIDLVLTPELTEFDGFVNYGSPINSAAPVGLLGLGGSEAVEMTPNAILMPVFSVNRANTALTVADGSTIVIGGLLQEKLIKVEDKTPVFGDIPLLGRLFRSDVSVPSRKVVLFFVNVELLDPTGRRFRER